MVDLLYVSKADDKGYHMPQRLNQTGREFHFLLAFIMCSVLSLNTGVEGTVLSLSSFAHYRVVPNPYDYLFYRFLKYYFFYSKSV